MLGVSVTQLSLTSFICLSWHDSYDLFNSCHGLVQNNESIETFTLNRVDWTAPILQYREGSGSL